MPVADRPGSTHPGITKRELQKVGCRIYFFCVGRQHHTCHEPHLAAEDVEAVVGEHYRTIQFPSELKQYIAEQVQATLTDQQTADALLRKQARQELARLDVQEENLLDLAADGGLDTAKIRRRLRNIQDQRTKLEADLAADDQDLKTGAQRLQAALDLLDDPHELYQRADDPSRRLLNQAIFHKLYIKGEEIIDDDLREPFAAPITAGRTWLRERAATGGRPKTKKVPVTAGDRDPRTPTDLLLTMADAQRVGGLSKAVVVGRKGLEPLTPCASCRCSSQLS